jgi:hypothetical protein
VEYRLLWMCVHAPDNGPAPISCISVINGPLSGEKTDVYLRSYVLMQLGSINGIMFRITR